MSLLEVPPDVREVLIAADHDRVNPQTGLRPGLHAAQTLAERLLGQGVKVSITLPPLEGTDWLDVRQSGGDFWGHPPIPVADQGGPNQPRLAPAKPHLGHSVSVPALSRSLAFSLPPSPCPSG